MGIQLDKFITIEPVEESILQVQEYVEEALDEAGVPMKKALKMHIVLDEVYSNVVFYSKASKVKVECIVSDQSITLEIIDDGMPYNPLEAKDPDITLDVEEREAGGLGIFITKKMMDEFDYKYENGFNCVKLVLNL